MTRLDDALKQLSAQPVPADLASLEPNVWARIDRIPNVWRNWRMPVSAVGLALIVGVITGLQPTPAAHAGEMDAFSLRPALLPSTLLLGGR